MRRKWRRTVLSLLSNVFGETTHLHRDSDLMLGVTRSLRRRTMSVTVASACQRSDALAFRYAIIAGERANRLHHLLGICAIALAAGWVTPLAAADDAPQSRTRVWSENATINRLIVQATERSATFRGEIEAINATDGLVYVGEGRCRGGGRACLIHTVDLPGPYRLLRVTIVRAESDLETMAAIGHELCHALEVLSDPRVRTDAAIAFFYRRIPSAATEAFETAAAKQAGENVFVELRASASGRYQSMQRGRERSDAKPKTERP